MGGGAAMRVVAKIAGGVNGSFRGGFPAFPENIITAAFKANTARPITGVISSSDTQYDVGQPLPRIVFGGAPTLEEAQDATFQLRTALDQAYLSNESSEGSCESDMRHDKLAISDSVHLEGKICVTKASEPNQAFRAFRLLNESPAVQTVVASIASDPNIWTAVTNNKDFLEYTQSLDTGMNGSLDESPADTEIPGYQSRKYSDDETFDEKESKNGFYSFFKFMRNSLSDDETFDEKESKYGFYSFFKFMRNSLSSFFQNLFAGSAAADGSGMGEKTMGASVMGLAVMVIMVVILKRV